MKWIQISLETLRRKRVVSKLPKIYRFLMVKKPLHLENLDCSGILFFLEILFYRVDQMTKETQSNLFNQEYIHMG